MRNTNEDNLSVSNTFINDTTLPVSQVEQCEVLLSHVIASPEWGYESELVKTIVRCCLYCINETLDVA